MSWPSASTTWRPTGARAPTHRAAQTPHSRPRSATSPQPTGKAGADDSRSNAHSERVDVARAVEAVADTWADAPDRLEARKAAATAVLTAALEGGAIGRSEAVDRFYDEYPVDGQNERTWYRKQVRHVLQECGTYSQGQQGYVIDELPTN
jgi:hypothetical protein